MTLPTPEPMDPPTAPGTPDLPTIPGEPSPDFPAEPLAPTPDEPTVPLPPEPSPDPSGADEVDGPTGTAELEADNDVEQDMVDAVDPGGRPD
ncbi:MAG: hypothetical protein IJO71_06140 [Microbacterium sp.]|uniref:hypothetical protein n=1 Tax=unclassified Microbacterium TaxID=2609290 RepID=UPI0024B7004C|nr:MULTISPECIES: hypothetical protein [unclassified Microbacterium]MBQ9916767.1 hypothetical protein [Microbacterium sp.]MDI9892179.1 hypothetical protein [Microbacterium sp. IEGM 1404]